MSNDSLRDRLLRASKRPDLVQKALQQLNAATPALAQHSKKNPNWQTPGNYIAAITTIYRELGEEGIDLDPMSSEIANISVGAARYCTPAIDCFTQPWTTRAGFINPAGGLVVEAWQYLCAEILAGRAQRFVWLGFSLEQAARLSDPSVDADGVPVPPEVRWDAGKFHPFDFSFCIPRKRISFLQEDGSPGPNPTHSNYVSFPGIPHWVVEKHFASFGRVFSGPLSVSE